MMTNFIADTNPRATDAEWGVPPSLAKLAALRPEQMCELVRAYLIDTTLRLEKIRAALADHRLEVVSKEAHTMIGSSSQMGAGIFAQLLRATEVAARSGAEGNAKEAVDGLMRSFGQISRSMGSYAAQMQGRIDAGMAPGSVSWATEAHSGALAAAPSPSFGRV